jgi:hypothetical protein
MPSDKVTKYITFKFAGYSDSGKTEKWDITNNHGHYILAVIYWYGPWHQYVIRPRENTEWNSGCLQEVQTFLTERNRLQRLGVPTDAPIPS